MKLKKIRGQRAVLKDIAAWKKANLHLDLEELQYRQRNYAKISVHPYSSISLLKSKFPEPKGETRKQLLKGLFEIYFNWKEQLESLGQPYYLKLWLYEPRFSKSQVVCAIGSALDFYANTFYKPERQKTFSLELPAELKERVADFRWEYAFDEEHLDEEYVGEPYQYASEADYFRDRRWFRNKLKGPHRKTISEDKEYYFYKLGSVWLGEIPKE